MEEKREKREREKRRGNYMCKRVMLK